MRGYKLKRKVRQVSANALEPSFTAITSIKTRHLAVEIVKLAPRVALRLVNRYVWIRPPQIESSRSYDPLYQSFG
jgi:hypothetical protein